MSPPEPVQDAAALLQAQDLVRIVCHGDGDGLAAAWILARSLDQLGVDFHVTALPRLAAGDVERLADVGHECVAFLDLAPGALPVHQAGDRVVVLDHHPRGDGRGKGPRPAGLEEDVVDVHARDLGADPGGACTASLAYRVAEATRAEAGDLLPLALSGAVADRQHLGGFRGWNADLLDEARDRGGSTSAGLLLHPDAGLLEALSREASPFLPRLGGRARAVRDFLEEAGLDPGRAVGDLPRGGAEGLVTAVALHLLEEGAHPDAVDDLVGPRVPVPVEGVRGVHDLAHLLEHAGRAGRAGLALGMALGSAEDLDELRDVARRRQDRLVQALIRVERDRDADGGPPLVFRAVDPSLLPQAADLVHDGLAGGGPALGLARADGEARIEVRGSRGSGGDVLGGLAEVCADRKGAAVGGHEAAAWAVVPEASAEDVVDAVAAALEGSP